MKEKKMKIMVLFILVLASLATDVGAVVYPKESPAQRLRADIGRQRVEYLRCLTRSALACEKTGVLPGTECVLSTSTAAMPADPQGNFPEAVLECDKKLNYARKAPEENTSRESYELVGCPGDSDGGTAGRQRFPDLTAYQAVAVSGKFQIDLLAALVTAFSDCTDTETCVEALRVAAGYVVAVETCQEGCENDYADRRGNGGLDDSLTRCSPGDPGADEQFALCVSTAEAKFAAKGEWVPGLIALINPAVGPIAINSYDVPDNCGARCTGSNCGGGGGTRCKGFSYDGACWFMGTASQSCDAVCTARALTCDEAATRDIAGSGGSAESCLGIADGLDPAHAPYTPYGDSDLTQCGPDLAVGCQGGPDLFHPADFASLHVTAPRTTCAADGESDRCNSLMRRVCACR